MIDLGEKYWSKRYEEGMTQWDVGAITTPLKEYFDQLGNKNMRIIIPGGGNGYEAEYLHNLGFKNVYLVDISEMPLKNFKQRNPDFPEDHLVKEDFFALKGTYDLMVEQTFFCALNPELRQTYAKKVLDILKVGGKLVGVLFNDRLNDTHPPFGGCLEEYIEYFRPYFKINKFEKCYNSIKPRQDREVWINLEKK